MSHSAICWGLALMMAILAGCATTHTIPSGGDIFKESAADVTNRAPASMSIPAELKENITNDPTYLRSQADYHFTIAESFSLEGNSARAIEEYKLTTVYDPKAPVVRLRLAAEYVKQGLVSEAMEQAKLAIEYDPKYEDGHLLMGGLYSALKMFDDALKEYQTVMQINPENTEAPMFTGALLAEQKKYPEATVYFDALAKNPKYRSPHLAYYYLGRIRLEENKPDSSKKAEEAFNKALTLRPAFVDAALALGQIYEGAKKRTEAVQHYRAFQEKYGPDESIADSLSRLYMEDEDYTNAYKQFEIIEAKDADNLNVKVKMAFILIEQKKYQDSILKLEEILTRAPYSDKIRFYLGAVYEEIKDFKSAISHFQKIPINSSYYAEGVIHSAYLYKLMGDFSNAIETVQLGIKNKSDHAPFFALYASFLDETRQYKQAAEMLGDATKKFPENTQLWFFLGSMQDRLGLLESTITSMSQVIKLDESHVQALNFLAYTFAENNRNLEEAEKLVRKATELQPNDAYIMDTLGWVLFKRGRIPEAVKTLEAAYKLQPTESIIAEHLGDAYYRHEMPDKAKKMYQRAAEIEQNPDTQQKIRAKLVSVDQQIQKLGEAPKRQPASAK